MKKIIDAIIEDDPRLHKYYYIFLLFAAVIMLFPVIDIILRETAK